MDQYRPCYQAFSHPPLGRRITTGEFEEAIRLAKKALLHRLHQDRPGTAISWLGEV